MGGGGVLPGGGAPPPTSWTAVPLPVRNALRGAIGATLPAPCTHCKKTVERTDAWDVDHIVPLHLGGDVMDRKNLGPSHSKCNRSAGATMGNLERNRSARRLRDWTSRFF